MNIVATEKIWNIEAFYFNFGHLYKNWVLISQLKDLETTIKRYKPEYVFFPHWSHEVPKHILDMTNCIAFHATKLPYGRGGSPIQNMIIRGHKSTHLTMFKMTEKLDEGDIYYQIPISLEGHAEEIYNRISYAVMELIKLFIKEKPIPKKQEGEPIYFKRRKPEESEMPSPITIDKLYDFIRMLDAYSYPKAFIKLGDIKIEFSNAILRTNHMECNVKITSLV